jgi:hypothetical protein
LKQDWRPATVLLVDLIRALLRRRSDLVLENLALRQQIAALVARREHPHVTLLDRWFWIALRRFWSRWTEVVLADLLMRDVSKGFGPGSVPGFGCCINTISRARWAAPCTARR